MKKPYVFFHGNIVMRPGDPVCIRGEDLDIVTKVVISDGTKTAEPEMIQQEAHSFKFIIPADFTLGAYRCELFGGDETEKFIINSPVVRWTQGDQGSIATPGGWIRAFGECLRVGGGVCAAELGGRKLEVSKIYDDYSVEFKVPADMPKGKAEFVYSNGFAEAKAIEAEVGADPRDAWPKDIFDVTEFGAKDCTDSSEGITKAIEAAAKNGGGIVYIPKGRYFVKTTFRIPKNTVIRGAGIKKTIVAWDGYTYEIGQLPEYMIRGTNNFAIEDLTFGGTRLGNFITNDTSEEAGENIYVNRIRVHANPTGGTRTHRGEEGTNRKRDILMETMTFSTDLFRFNCTNLQITDNEFIWGGRPVGSGNNRYTLFRNNDFDGMATIDNWVPLGYNEKAIIEDNMFRGYTIGTSGAYVYYSRNTMREVLDNNREAFTTDMGGGTMYHGTVEKITATKYLFPFESNVAALNSTASMYNAGKAVYILSGRGMGQHRKIVGWNGDEVQIDAPFDVEPDETSHVTVNAYNDCWYMADNVVHDAGDFQFFVPQVNTVLDGTKCSFCRGIVGWGGAVYGGWCTQWYISYINNDLSDGNYYHMEGCDRCTMEIRGTHHGEATTVANIVRGNKFADNSSLAINSTENPESITDLMIYDNEIEDCDEGVVFYNSTKNTFMMNNRFTDVKNEVVAKVPQENLKTK